MIKFLIIFFIFISSAYGALTDNLQGRWKMEEASGDIIDEQGNNNLVAGGSPTYQQAALAPEGSYSIAYSSAYHYSGTNPTNLNITGSLSLMAWVRTGTVTNDTYPCGRINSNLKYCYWFYVSGTTLQFKVSSTGGGVGTAVNMTTALADNTTYHIVGVYDGTDLRIYKDGSLDCTPTTYSSGIFSTTSARFTIAARWGDDPVFDSYFPGRLDEVAIWNRALTSTEVNTLYTDGFAAPPPPGVTVAAIVNYPLLKSGDCIGKQFINGGFIN